MAGHYPHTRDALRCFDDQELSKEDPGRVEASGLRDECPSRCTTRRIGLAVSDHRYLGKKLERNGC